MLVLWGKGLVRANSSARLEPPDSCSWDAAERRGCELTVAWTAHNLMEGLLI